MCVKARKTLAGNSWTGLATHRDPAPVPERLLTQLPPVNNLTTVAFSPMQGDMAAALLLGNVVQEERSFESATLYFSTFRINDAQQLASPLFQFKNPPTPLEPWCDLTATLLQINSQPCFLPALIVAGTSATAPCLAFFRHSARVFSGSAMASSISRELLVFFPCLDKHWCFVAD